MKILYLEDDINLSETISEFLEDNDFEVTCVYSSDELLDIVYDKIFDIFIFDVNVPNKNGFELLKELRDTDINTPTIFTTTLNDINSLDKGYESGADDYLRKPFSVRELLHRINALVKRDFNTQSTLINIDTNIEYNITSQELKIDNNIVSLNTKEKTLLQLFMQNRNQLLSTQNIENNLWVYSEEVSETSLRTYIKNLRKLLGKEKIVNIKKQGYKLIV